MLCPFPLSGRPAWSADGRYLVLGQRGLWLYEVETGRRLRLTAGGRALALDGNLEEDPCWLPYPL